MVKNVLFFVGFLYAYHAVGQGFTPSALEVYAMAPTTSATEVFIYFEHAGGDTLTLKWRKGDVVQPEGWLVDICDYGLCYNGIPSSGVMTPFAAPTQAYLKLVVRPEGLEGNGDYGFRVFNINTPDNYVDVVMHVQTPGFTSTAEVQFIADLRVFPNPVNSGVVRWENISSAPLYLRMTDALGREVASAEVQPFATHTQDVSLLAKGIYYIFNERKNLNINDITIQTLLIN